MAAATACLSSPSSGYSSADEGRATPVDSDWASPTDYLLSSDPYLGELVMTPGGIAARRPVDPPTAIPSSWSGTSLVLDDFMDTIWDSLASGIDVSSQPGIHSFIICSARNTCTVVVKHTAKRAGLQSKLLLLLPTIRKRKK